MQDCRVRTGRRDQDQQQPQHHGPQRRPVGPEPRPFVPPERRTRHRQIALRPTAADRHRPPSAVGGPRSGARRRGRHPRRRRGCRRHRALRGLHPVLGWEPERVAIELLPPRCCRPAPGTRRNACLGHVIDLFLVLTGLADGLAPKERRFATRAIRPNNLGPPLPPLAWCRAAAGFQLSLADPNNDCGWSAVWRPEFPRNVRAGRGPPRAAGTPGRVRPRPAGYSWPATLATNFATSSASIPCTTSAGITPSPRQDS